MTSPLEALTDMELIRILHGRGYVVRHKSEASNTLSWHRTASFPSGVDFEAEALSKLREQLTVDHIDFRIDLAEPAGTSTGDRHRPGEYLRPETHHATLRVLAPYREHHEHQ